MTVRHDRQTTIRIDRKALGDGSERRDAYLTRAGIFVYYFDAEDGQGYREIRELRPPEEVFAQESLDSLKQVAVVLGHPATIDSNNWKNYLVGNVADDVRQEGNFVAGSIIVRDKSVRDGLDEGTYGEVSCGYSVDLDWTSGEYEGERYDAIQRNIRYNHVGIGDAKNWGRAGADVRIRDAYDGDMKTDNQTRIDAPAGAPNTNADADTLRRDLDSARSDNDRLRGERDSARSDADKEKARADKAEGERDALQAKLDAAQKTDEQIEARVSARLELVDAARPVLGKDFVFKGKSDREIRVAVIQKTDENFDSKEKSDDYIQGRFDRAIGEVVADRDALGSLNTTANEDTGNADTKSTVEDSRAEMLNRNANAWRGKKSGNK